MDNEYFWVNVFFSVILLTLYITIIRKVKGLKIHIYIYTAIWSILVWGNQIIGTPYIITIKTLLVTYSAWLSFLLGAIAVFLYCSTEALSSKKEVTYSAKRLRFALYVLIGLSLIANYLYFKDVTTKLQGITNLALLRTSKARDILTESNMFFNLFGRSYNIYIPMAFLLFNKKQLSTFVIIIVIIIAFITSAAVFTRAPILNVLICILVSALSSGKKIKLNLTTASITASFFGLLYYLTNEINTTLSGVKVKNADELLFNSFFVYIFGGIRAYETVLEGTYKDFESRNYDSSFYTFDFLNYFLKRLGFIDKYPNLIREYMPGDVLPTNVYTYLDCFTLDFGVVGALIGSCLVGILTTYFAIQAQRKKTITMTVVYCYCCYAISMIFMTNEFIRNTLFLMLIPIAFVEFIARLNMDTTSPADTIATL